LHSRRRTRRRPGAGFARARCTEGARGVFQVKDSTTAGVAQEAAFVKIETGLEDGGRVEVLAGLSDGARVVTTGAAALRPGDPVTVAAASPAR
jgi:hypothetical protein